MIIEDVELAFIPSHYFVVSFYQYQERDRIKEELNYKKKTRKRTRKFEVDGVIVTTTTSKVIYGDDDDSVTNYHLNRKQELREFKLLQKQEQKQCQDLNLRAHMALEAQVKFHCEYNTVMQSVMFYIKIHNVALFKL